MKSAKLFMLVAATAGLMTLSTAASAFAGAFSTAACKACHSVDKDGVGPAFKSIAEKYGDEKALAAVFKSGFKVEDRKVAQSIAKWKTQAPTMTGQYNNLIKKGGNEDTAAEALFGVTKAGKF